MNQQKVLGWLLAAGALAAVSCSIPRTHYYLLEYPHTPPAPAPTVASSIAVQRFQAEQIFVDDRIVYRQSPNEVNHYEYERWAGPPEDLVTNYVIHRLNDSGSYAQVSSYKNGPQSDFILQGRIHHFEEVDLGKEVSASVDLELELVNGTTRATVWRDEATCSKPLTAHTVNGVAQGIHACLEETAAKLLGEMHTQLEKAGAVAKIAPPSGHTPD